MKMTIMNLIKEMKMTIIS